MLVTVVTLMPALCFLYLWENMPFVMFPCGMMNVFKKRIGSSHFHKECYALLFTPVWSITSEIFKGRGRGNGREEFGV